MWYVVGAIAVIIIAFVAWRWTSVERGARQRDERILERLLPIAQKLEAGETVTPDEVLQLARSPEVRFILFAALKDKSRPELIPSDFNSPVDQAESALVYWMMHPNELEDPPEKIEHVQEVTCQFKGADAHFHVFRYRMPEGHWAAADGWLLGLAGPMSKESEPYASMPGAFSRIVDKEGEVAPQELVDWYIDMLRQKGLAA